jgi:hypothetical protein
MNTNTIQLNLSKNSTVAKIPLNNKGVMQYIFCIDALNPGDLSKIPKSKSQPRDLDVNSSKITAIRHSLREKQGLSVKSGGMEITIDPSSFEYNEKEGWVKFTCSTLFSGTWDGQHTTAAILQEISDILQGVSKIGFQFQSCRMVLTEDSFFKDLNERREVATAINARTPQEIRSEHNVRGDFDNLKANLVKAAGKIGFKQHEKYSQTLEVIPVNSSITEVTALLAQYLGLNSYDGQDPEYANKARRKGARIVTDFWPAKGTHREVANQLVNIADTTLEICDYVQSSWATIPGFDSKRVLRKHSKAKFNKPVNMKDSERYIYHRFTMPPLTEVGGSVTEMLQVKSALLEDFLPVALRAILNCVVKVDNNYCENGGPLFSLSITLSEVKKFWDFAKADVLEEFEKIFQKEFAAANYRTFIIVENQAIWNMINQKVSDLYTKYQLFSVKTAMEAIEIANG